MLAERTSPSIRHVILAMVYVLAMRGLGLAEQPAAALAAKLSGHASTPREDPALQVKITVDFKAPKAQEIVDRLRAETKMSLMLADNINQKQPALGSLSCRNVPAWIIMDELAKSKIIQGTWQRAGDGYCLTSPLPPPVLAKAEPPPPPVAVGPGKLGPRYLLAALPPVLILGIAFLVHRWRKPKQESAASENRAVPKLPTSA